MRTTAGYCITGQERNGGSRYARIELSEKVCDSAGNAPMKPKRSHELWLLNNSQPICSYWIESLHQILVALSWQIVSGTR